ncbi:hypothetical protein ACYSNR_03110 [Enterococcus sp. LJL128]
MNCNQLLTKILEEQKQTNEYLKFLAEVEVQKKAPEFERIALDGATDGKTMFSVRRKQSRNSQ